MERDPYEGGSDVGPRPRPRSRRRAAGVHPRYGAGRPRADRRRRAGQRPRPGARSRASRAVDSPEHDWTVARDLVRPGLPTGRHAGPGARIDRPRRPGRPRRGRATPSRWSTSGPAGTPGRLHDPGRRLRHRRQRRPPPVVGHRAAELQDAALRNLAAWAATAAVDRGIVGRAPAHQLRYRRWPRRRPHPAARRRRRTCPASSATARPGPGRAPGAAPAGGRVAAPGRRRTSPPMFAEFVVETVGRGGRADRPARIRAGRRAAGRFRRMTDGLRVEVDGPVATLTLDRPEALNALTVPLKDGAPRRAHRARPRTAPSGRSS